jgi:hypothetical protein
MAPRRPQLAVALVAGLLLALPSPAAAKQGALSGRVIDGKVPTGAAGAASVRAVSAADGVIAATADVARSGAWSLELDPGWYVVTTSVVRPDKRAISAIAPVQRVRSGRRTRTKVSLERTRTPRVRRNRRSARAAATPSPAVAVKSFTGTGPNSQLGRGLAQMVTTELVNSSSGDCEPTVVEWEHRAELQREIDLSNSAIADPRSRIPRGHFIEPAVFVQGTVTTTVTSTSWALQLVDATDGSVVGEETGSADGLAILDAAAGIAQRLADELCGADYRVNVTIDALVTAGSYVGSGVMVGEVVARPVGTTTPPTSWAGQVPVAVQGLRYGGVPGCVVTPGSHDGYLKVEVQRIPGDLIQVTWGGETFGSTVLVCPGATIPNGVPPLMPFQGTQPGLVVFPVAGGTQSLSGGLPAPGGGWVNTGTLTVTRLPHGTL